MFVLLFHANDARACPYRCYHLLSQIVSFPTVCSFPILSPSMVAKSEAEAEAEAFL